MSTVEHARVAEVTAALVGAGMADSASGIVLLDAEARTAALAAAALGVGVGAIANSLVFAAEQDTVDGATEVVPLLALTSGVHRADPVLLARAIGARTVGKADATFVRTHTGQPIGGVAPVGHPAPIRTLVDTALADYPTVWAAAGHPRSVFPTTYAQLLELTGGTPATVAADG